MRKHLFLGAALLCSAGPALAHEVDGAIAGESEVVKPPVIETLLDALIPSAGAAATVTIDGDTRIIKGDGYPDSKPGRFPNSGNPNRIEKKNYSIRLPAKPVVSKPTPVSGGLVFGISVDGVLMEGLTGEFWNNDRRSGWNYYAFSKACRLGLDHNNAHVQPDGTYHYHGVPTGVVSEAPYKDKAVLVGYAADGFPIYGPMGPADPNDPDSPLKQLKSSYQVKQGTRPSEPGGRYNGTFVEDYAYIAGSGDLDQCNGRVAKTDQYPEGTYHYVITEEFPNIPLCWMGEPSSSLARIKGRPGGGAGGPERPGGFGRPPGGPSGPGGPGGPGVRPGGPGGGPCSGS